MNVWARHTTAGRGMFCVLAACALLFRILIPSGFMPTTDAGGMHISLCTGEGAVDAVIGLDGKVHKTSPGSSGKMSGPCLFTCLGFALATIAVGFKMLCPVEPPRAIFRSVPALSVGRGLAAPPPPARGPPGLI